MEVTLPPGLTKKHLKVQILPRSIEVSWPEVGVAKAGQVSSVQNSNQFAFFWLPRRGLPLSCARVWPQAVAVRCGAARRVDVDAGRREGGGLVREERGGTVAVAAGRGGGPEPVMKVRSGQSPRPSAASWLRCSRGLGCPGMARAPARPGCARPSCPAGPAHPPGRSICRPSGP